MFPKGADNRKNDRRLGLLKKVLVTGADGFLGRHLVKKLLSEGKDVFGIVCPDSKEFDDLNEDHLHIKKVDINEASQLEELFPVGEIDVMYHFAWAGVKPEERNDYDVQIKNVGMTMKCMELASLLKIKRIVFPGSCNEYLYYGKPLDRNAVASPFDAYGAVKIALKYLCASYCEYNGIDFVYTILTGVYSADRCDNNVITYTVKKLLCKEKPIFTKLEQTWDYIYIDDAVEALFLVGEKGRKNAIYSIGHGDNWKLRKYIDIIHNAIDASLPLGIGEIPYSDDRIPCVCIDLTDLQRDTGFVPRVDFENGIKKVIKTVKSDMGFDTE